MEGKRKPAKREPTTFDIKWRTVTLDNGDEVYYVVGLGWVVN